MEFLLLAPYRPYLNRVAFVAVTLTAVFAVYALLVSPLWSILEAQKEESAQLTVKLAHLQVLADRESEARDLLSKLDADRQIAIFLRGDKEGAASAGLQLKLKHIAEQAGARVQSIEGLDHREIDGTRYLGVRLVIKGRIAAIHAVLTAIEQSTPLLFVTALSIHAPLGTFQPLATQEPYLDAQLDIVAATHGPIDIR